MTDRTDIETTALSDLPESAHAFVKSSWVRSWRRRWSRSAKADEQVFHRSFPDLAEWMARNCDVRVLHFAGNTDFYVGWVATSGPGVVHYVYVRKNFRNSGNARWLLSQFASAESHYTLQPVTRWQQEWAAAHGMKYDPYQIAITAIGAHDEQKQATDDPR